METKDEVCNVCGGTGINKAKAQNLSKNEPIEYEPIECQNCGGSGKEPK
ncbi:hypothetical protein [Photobacterium satsumensis]